MEFHLKQGNRFAGRVVDQAGQPVANVEVGTGSDNQGLKKVEFETHTDAQGRFEWNSAPEEKLLFYVRGKGIRILHDLSLGPGEHELKVMREERDHILITGKVVDAKTGEPVPEFHITIGEEINGDARELDEPRNGRSCRRVQASHWKAITLPTICSAGHRTGVFPGPINEPHGRGS